MTPSLLLAVALAGGVGAVLRWGLELAVTRWAGPGFPWGILLVNVTGSFALGVVSGALGSSELATVLGTGLLGGYTTFSSVAAMTALMLQRRLVAAALFNALGSLVLCVLTAILGVALGTALR
ncbi:fluoride efflux transporter FluC [Microbacterium gorillae]|uniref:fluoride efflux transporter FluC n=1 Tax=Microbacterium gorillae TaxID=1231063 RepID=UPI00058DC4F1|nr:CrcB family protein [Microbacterium gorillae]